MRIDDKGQAILILILVMTVALSIGLSVVQKSLVDVSTASKVEQSSRAFSAAEAGVEKALQGDNSIQNFSDNSSKITSIDNKLNPCVPGAADCIKAVGTQQDALEFPPLAKEDVAQVWLADYNSATNPPTAVYTQNNLDIYWGNSSTDKAAIEVTLVYHDGTQYKSQKWFTDNASATRTVPNQFDTVNCPATYIYPINTYQCKRTLDFTSIKTANPSATWMLIRVRLLYNSTSQPFAVQPPSTAICGAACSLPPQARTITSTGVSGDTQRKVNIFQLYKVVPPYFDYAIFSAGEIKK